MNSTETLPDSTPAMHILQAVLTEVVVDVTEPPAQAFAAGRQLLEHGVGSLQLLQIHAGLEEAFGMEIPKEALFEYATIGELARYLSEANDRTLECGGTR